MTCSRALTTTTLIFLLTLYPSTGRANAPETWTLAKLIERAKAVSPLVKAAQSEIVAAEGQAHQAGRWDNPEFSVSGGPTTFSVLNGYAYEFGLKQSIPLFGQKSRASAVERQSQILAETNLSLTSLALQHTVARLAYDLLAAEIHSQHVTHRRENINLIGQYLKSRPFASPSQAVEKSLIENRIREIEEKSIETAVARTRQWRELNVYLDLKSEIIPVLSWFEAMSLPSEVELRTAALIQHPELQRQEIALKQSELMTELASSKAYPEIRIGGGYGYQSIDQPQSQYVGTLEFTLPLWDAGGGAKQSADAKKVIEESRLDLVQRQAAAEFDQAWVELQASKKRIELYPLRLITSLEADMRKAEINWKKGLVPAASFLELESQVHEQADHVYEAQIAYVDSLSKVLQLAGRDFPMGSK